MLKHDSYAESITCRASNNWGFVQVTSPVGTRESGASPAACDAQAFGESSTGVGDGRLFWVLFSTHVDGWRKMLHALHPDTVVRWHREGFRRCWCWKSRRGSPGRPPIDRVIRKLIREMQSANVGWGAPRIHGELLKLGIESS